jgi:serine phosphatase RsbU (regulator of sigma subunit)
MGERPIIVAVAARQYPGEAVSGDAWQFDWSGSVCRIALVDGLGHGPEAAAAAAAATSHLASRPDLDPETAVRSCHSELNGTRGAARLVVRLDATQGRLTVAGVGNIEARLWQDGRAQHLLSDRGIVGVTLPRVRPLEISLEARWLLLVYTDGIRNRFDLPSLLRESPDPNTLANTILNDWGRVTDDATVLVAQPR